MRYALLLHYPELSLAELGETAIAEGMQAFDRYASALDAAGVLRSAEILAPSTATTTVTTSGGTTDRVPASLQHDGEPLGGTTVIEVDGEDAAVGWAERSPSAAWGHVEVRQVVTRYVGGAWEGTAPTG